MRSLRALGEFVQDSWWIHVKVGFDVVPRICWRIRSQEHLLSELRRVSNWSMDCPPQKTSATWHFGEDQSPHCCNLLPAKSALTVMNVPGCSAGEEMSDSVSKAYLSKLIISIFFNKYASQQLPPTQLQPPKDLWEALTSELKCNLPIHILAFECLPLRQV